MCKIDSLSLCSVQGKGLSPEQVLEQIRPQLREIFGGDNAGPAISDEEWSAVEKEALAEYLTHCRRNRIPSTGPRTVVEEEAELAAMAVKDGPAAAFSAKVLNTLQAGPQWGHDAKRRLMTRLASILQ